MNKQCERFFKTAVQFRKLKIANVLLNISHSEYMTLKTIECCRCECENSEAGVKVSMLSEKMQVNNTAVSRTLKSLESLGLIERTINEKDRRVVYVRLTEKGKEELKDSDAAMDEYTDAVFKQLNKDEIVQISDLLDKMYKLASKELEKRKKEKER